VKLNYYTFPADSLATGSPLESGIGIWDWNKALAKLPCVG